MKNIDELDKDLEKMRAGSVLKDFCASIENRKVRNDVKKILKVIDDYRTFYLIFHYRRTAHPEEYFGPKIDKNNIKTFLHFEESNKIFDSFSFETLRILDASALLIIGGYYESAFSLFRIAMERMIYSLYFTFDHESFEKWKSGSKYRVTGEGGLIDKLSNPKFLKKKTGIELPLIEEIPREILTEIYSIGSDTFVHGKFLASNGILGAISQASYKHRRDTKAAADEARRSVMKSELDHLDLFSKSISAFLDLFAYLHYRANVVLCREKFFEMTEGEKTFLEILPSFPRTQNSIPPFKEFWMKKIAGPKASSH